MKAPAALLATALVASPGLACAPAAGDGRFVHVDAEDALIIWDAPAQREHFIRRALLETNAKDFGFLVPTPGKPELGEADDSLFERLASLAAPARLAAPKPAVPVSKGLPPAPAVSVLERKVVAGLDAAVLEATDPGALYRWLEQHGYRSDPGLVAWTRPYVEHGWKITAFKIAGAPPQVSTGAVRMSFQAERPFFPYREPQSQRGAGADKRERLLRVYFLADARFAGRLGEQNTWQGQAVWSNRISEDQRLELLKLAGLPVMAGGGGRRLTAFEDRSSPRPGTDEIYFARAADQSVLVPAPAAPREAAGFALGDAPAAILFLLGAGLAYSVWRFMKRRHG